MIRLISRLLVLAAITAFVVAIMAIEGRTAIDLGPWQIRLETYVLILAIVGLLVLTVFAVGGFGWFWGRVNSGIQARRTQKTLENTRRLLKGFALLAADLPAKAQRHVIPVKGSPKSEDPDALVAGVLAALATSNGRVEETGRIYLEAALEDEALIPLALKGLLSVESIRQDAETMTMLLDIAAQKASEASWSRELLYDRAVSAKNWQAAAQLVAGDGKSTQEKRAALILEGARLALERGDAKSALDQAEQARQQAPGWSPALVLSMKAGMALGRKRRIFTALQEAWRDTPHSDLIQVFQDFTAKDKPDEALKKAHQLVGKTPEGYAAKLLLAQTLLRTGREEDIRRVVEDLSSEYPTKAVLRLRVRLAQTESTTRSAYWMQRLSEASDAGLWGCTSCGHSQDDWSFSCSSCGAEGRMDWRTVEGMETETDLPTEALTPAGLAVSEATSTDVLASKI